MKTSEIASMSKIQRLQAMEVFWDSLIHEATEPESPDWHRDVLAARRHSLENGKAEFFSLEELKARNKK